MEVDVSHSTVHALCYLVSFVNIKNQDEDNHSKHEISVIKTSQHRKKVFREISELPLALTTT